MALGKLFGSSSEKISPDQLAFEFGVDSVAPGMPEAEAEMEEVVIPRKKRKYKPLSERIPEDLPVEEAILEPAAVLADPEAFRRIGEEVTEELDVVQTKFFKRRTVRPKYVRKFDRSLPPVVAPRRNLFTDRRNPRSLPKPRKRKMRTGLSVAVRRPRSSRLL